MRRSLFDVSAGPCLRLVLGLAAAAVFLLAVGPFRRRAQKRGAADWRLAPVQFHRILCAALRLRVRRFGEPSAAPRRLIASNHISWLDIPVLGSLEPMTFLAKKEVGGSWLGRWCAGLQGVVYVDRSRRRAVPEVNDQMTRALRKGEAVLLFAEATTGDGNRVLPFRSSHFQPLCALAAEGAVVQPVFLHYARLGGMKVTRRDRPHIAWYGDMTFFPHLFRLLDRPALSCDVYYADPIPVGPEATAKSLAREAEASVRRIAAELGAGAAPTLAAISATPETR